VIPRPLLRPLWATAGIAALSLAWMIGAATTSAMKTQGLPEGEQLDLAITLNFKPEAFHITRAQELGQLVRVDGDTLYIAGVRREAAEDFARYYWVARLEPWRRAP
jgi:hypothetical protein